MCWEAKPDAAKWLVANVPVDLYCKDAVSPVVARPQVSFAAFAAHHIVCIAGCRMDSIRCTLCPIGVIW